LDLYWSCPATFTFFFIWRKMVEIIYIPFYKGYIWTCTDHVLQLSHSFLSEEKWLKSSTSPFTKGTFGPVLTMSYNFHILFYLKKTGWNHLHPLLQRVHLDLYWPCPTTFTFFFIWRKLVEIIYIPFTKGTFGPVLIMSYNFHILFYLKKTGWNHLHPLLQRVHLDLYWPCPATFTFFFIWRKLVEIIYIPFYKGYIWTCTDHVLQLSDSFLSEEKWLKSSTSPLTKGTFGPVLTMSYNFHILFYQKKTGWNHLHPLLQRVHLDLYW
jgi:predicted carbohydrate-binding protein with CBM5 and CBM33 domain